jgi:CDGSH-type Zn-finger protein
MVKIEATKNGPYIVNGKIKMRDPKGRFFDEKETMLLCRCGKSGTKPFCDGTHAKVGFKGDKEGDRVPDRMDNYEGKDITIHDNRGVCSHAGHCTDNVPTVWRPDWVKEGKDRWIDPNGSDPIDIEAVCKLCPSGALSFTRDGRLVKNFDRAPIIKISKDGPYRVAGGPELIDEATGSKPESTEHYALCRCGASKNKPFCNGQHWHVKFSDE